VTVRHQEVEREHVIRPAQQLVAGAEWRRSQTVLIDGEDFRVEMRVAKAQLYAAALHASERRADGSRELDAASSRVRDVVGAVVTRAAERAGGHDQVIIVVEEERGLDESAPANE
jgi:hypothetical protein